MAILKRTFVATGGRTGLDFAVGKLKFVKGRLNIMASEKDIEGLTRYLGRAYQAFPSDSVELAQYQEADRHNHQLAEVLHGTGQANPKSDSGQHDAADAGGVPAGEQEPGPLPTDNGSGSVEGGNDPAQLVPEGDGSQGARILEAVKTLDPVDDELWTADGLPRVDALSKLLGIPTLGRKDVEAAAPGFVRPQKG